MKPEIEVIYKNCYDVINDLAREVIEASLPRQKDVGSDKYWEMYQEVEEQIFKPYQL